jgi:hypothetical protein
MCASNDVSWALFQRIAAEVAEGYFCKVAIPNSQIEAQSGDHMMYTG